VRQLVRSRDRRSRRMAKDDGRKKRIKNRRTFSIARHLCISIYSDRVETLADEKRDLCLSHHPHSSCVSVEISRGEALVGAVEEDVVLLGEDDRDKLLPLFVSRVDTGRLQKSKAEADERSSVPFINPHSSQSTICPEA
jgi:hypothetical protein